MSKFLGVIYVNDCRTNTPEWYAHLAFYLVVVKDTQHDKRVYQSLCVEDQAILEKMRYGWEKWEIWKMRMNASHTFYLLSFVLSDRWYLYGLLTPHLCGKPQPRNADLWKMVVQNQAGWMHCYKWFKKWFVNDSFFLHTSIWYRTKVTRMA